MLTLNDDNRLQSIFQERFYGRRAFLKCVTKNFNYELSNYWLDRPVRGEGHHEGMEFQGCHGIVCTDCGLSSRYHAK